MKSTRYFLGLGSALLLIAAGTAHAAGGFEAPVSVGKAKLGMKLDEVKAAYPDLVVREADETNSKPVPPFAYGEGILEGQKFGELQACRTKFRFFQKSLIQIELTCATTEDISAVLVKAYGPPSAKTDDSWDWRGEDRWMSYAPLTKQITLLMKRASEDFQNMMLLYVMQAQPGAQSGAAPAAPPPAAK